MSGNDPDTDPPVVSIRVEPPASMVKIAVQDAWRRDADSPSSGRVSRFESREQLENWFVEATAARWKYLFGRPDYPVSFCGVLQSMAAVKPVELLPVNGGISALTAGRAAAFSGWTAALDQVAGVDELDLVETDGTYLAMISRSSLVIVDGLRSGQPRVVARIDLDPTERPLGIFLTGDRLAVVSATGSVSGGGVGIWREGIRCGWPPTTPARTVVTVFDVADRSSPTLVQRTSMDGSLVTARVVGGQLRLVLNAGFEPPPLNRLPIVPQPAFEDQDGGAGIGASTDVGMTIIGGPVSTTVPSIELKPMVFRPGFSGDRWRPTSRFETEAEYFDRVRDGLVDAMMPMMRSLDGSGNVLEESSLVSAVDVWHGHPDRCRNLTVLATFDLERDTAGPTDTAGVFTAGDVQVYATTDAIYLFDTRWAAGGQRSDVLKFVFPRQSHGIELEAQGDFAGRLLNQFAADEHGGRLRVVVEGLPDGHGVHVLERHGSTLDVSGSLTGLAAGESLYSVRFAGERGYFVTFRQVDPLFVVDFSDPVQPAVRGVLHVPGFSDTLIPIDDTHLLAVGRDADERTGLFGDLQISLFDVSDPDAPRLVDRYAFAGGRGTTTPVTGNRWVRGDGDHLAAGYDSQTGLFTLPVEAGNGLRWWEPAGSGEAAGATTGLHAFRIDVHGRHGGIEPLGVVTHADLVNRSMGVAGRLVAVSADAVSVHEADDPNACLGSVVIEQTPGLPLGDVASYRRPVESPSEDNSVVLVPATGDGGNAAGGGAGELGHDAGWFAIEIGAQISGSGGPTRMARGRSVQQSRT